MNSAAWKLCLWAALTFPSGQPRAYNERTHSSQNQSATTWSSGMWADAASPNIPKDVLEKWEMMRALHPGTLQFGCEPQIYSPPPGVRFRGVALLLHGFSACPGQYEILGPRLAALGYEVLVPLYPGHGRIPKQLSPRVDDVDMVPTNPSHWSSFTREMNELAASFEGEKVLVGLSLGSNIALRAIQFEPTLYDKAYVMAPKLRNESSFLSGILHDSVDTFGIEEFILGQRAGWPQCEREESIPPHNRPGFCYMQKRHGMAMLDFGQNVVDASVADAKKGKKIRTKVQFVVSRNDDGVCNRATLAVFSGLIRAGNESKVCIMPKPVPHSMFSLRDKPFQKPWVPALFQSIEDFFLSEQFVEGSGQSASECHISW
jgi:pimeloyl-ACP methyl ester carboxylesterase